MGRERWNRMYFWCLTGKISRDDNYVEEINKYHLLCQTSLISFGWGRLKLIWNVSIYHILRPRKSDKFTWRSFWKRIRKTRRLRERNQIRLIVTFHHLIERGESEDHVVPFQSREGEKEDHYTMSLNNALVLNVISMAHCILDSTVMVRM